MHQIPAVYSQTPEQLVRSLMKAGWSQLKIAATIETTQPTVCRILNGQHKDPRYSLVERLRRAVIELNEFQSVA
ncbi:MULTISPECIES: Cro/Cl family transcriptional regulator [Burkholderia]|uniref:Transcriptional regulator n=1 Tax=Burkholderia contaminans TaxID=488447 RepID=A0A2S5DRQ6_9BURK|nr:MULTISPECIES: Cro/Cl family transcriptional regulator [Burkholderia]EKS9794851.1 transcriptional regulator [Burkholderia cepacia]EKS9802806.1 transcriptional regulator [Burkholderia cepacia]EKS9809313.1 transcriptional regulator [Burkholderia cepacia]EKS9818174.1 transcriptional regulator [Burkholderia cepacia]EKS9824168.1 transcriptional regulator [Burkholderia cepacia]